MTAYRIELLSLFPADVKTELDDLSKAKKNFAARVEFTKKMESVTAVSSVTTSCLTVKMLCKAEMRTLRLFFFSFR